MTAAALIHPAEAFAVLVGRRTTSTPVDGKLDG